MKELLRAVYFVLMIVCLADLGFARQNEIPRNIKLPNQAALGSGHWHEMNAKALETLEFLKRKPDQYLPGRIIYKLNNSLLVYPLTFDERISVEDMLRYMQSLPNVEFAQPDFVYRVAGISVTRMNNSSVDRVSSSDVTPNDPYYPIQPHLQFIGMDEVYKKYGFKLGRDEMKGEDIHIHIVDSGGGCDHPDINPENIIPEKDYIDSDDNPCTSPNGISNHGSFILSVMATKTNNGHGGAGIVPNARFHIWRIFDKNGSSSSLVFSAALSEIVNRSKGLGNEIVSLSLGSEAEDPLIKYWVSYGSIFKKITFVAASGNRGKKGVFFPAAFPEVIAVGATTFPDARTGEKKRALYSNYGPEVEITVPTGDINEDRNKDGRPDGIVVEGWVNEINDLRGIPEYKMYVLNGTSPATAVVSGLVGLLMATGIRDLEKLRKIIARTADDIPPYSRDDDTGWGTNRAYIALASTDARLPVFGFFSQETYVCDVSLGGQSCTAVVHYTIEPRGWRVSLQDNFGRGTIRELKNYQGEETISVNVNSTTSVFLVYDPEDNNPIVFGKTTVIAKPLTVPSAISFTANSSSDITASPGNSVSYQWSSNGGTSYGFDLIVQGPLGETCDLLGNCSGQVFFFIPNSGGSLIGTVDFRQVGYTYTFTYTVTRFGDYSRAYATVRVKAPTLP